MLTDNILATHEPTDLTTLCFHTDMPVPCTYQQLFQIPYMNTEYRVLLAFLRLMFTQDVE